MALNRVGLDVWVCVCACVGGGRFRCGSASRPICAYILFTANKKPDGVAEACLFVLHAHVQKAGHETTDKGNRQDVTQKINIHKALYRLCQLASE
jgi:hypothetical protein